MAIWLIPLFAAGAYAAYKGYTAAAEAIEEHYTPPAGFTGPMCRVRPGQFDQMTTFIQGALHAKDTSVAPAPTGIWDDQLCKEWWQVMKEPPSTKAVHKLIPPTAEMCKEIALPKCEDPNKALRGLVFAGGAAAVAGYVWWKGRKEGKW